MKCKFKMKQVVIGIVILGCLFTPLTVSAQTYWDFLTFEYWLSIADDDKGDPNDDKKKKPTQPPPTEPIPGPVLELCFDGPIPVPCPVGPIDN